MSRKICIIGDFAVGKTSLVRRYVLNQFSPNYQATLGVNVYKYTDEISTGTETLTLSQILWDIEGAKNGRDVIETYLRGGAGALVVGDATRAEAVENMQRTAATFLAVQPGRPVVFALNKIDLLPAGAEFDDTATADELGGPVVRTSAATGASVPQLFRTLGQLVAEVDG
ncbi:MAG: GTP-binding protein [Inquilinus sp.]|nr:GTP-binding protein [Inquilinus sp.]